MKNVWLVAEREIRQRGGSRSFQVSSVITIVIVLAIIIVPAIFSGDDDPPTWSLLVVGNTPEAFEELAGQTATSQEANLVITHLSATDTANFDPETDVVDQLEDHDAVLVNPASLYTKESTPDALVLTVQIGFSQAQLVAGLTDAGLTATQIGEALQSEPLDVVGEDESDQETVQSAAALIGVIALFIAINSYGAWVLSGVLEEKSSRVVEVVLAAVPARSLLAGKVIGIGLLGLAQLTTTAILGLGAAMIFSSVSVPWDLLPAMLSVLGWFILGFGFYAVAFAAAGSLVSRQEDAQSAVTPLTVTLLAGYFVSLGVVGPNPSSLAARIVSYIPFTAPMVMPARIAQGAASPVDIVGSVLVTLLGAWFLIRIAARIYERSILRLGAPIRIWTALRELRN